ncbi:hypothetical protein AB2_29 [Acinetobacter phage vB_AbaM-IME-AB2]|uniref:Uncharacterized protein n=1 Tax=Acinetobacter phage vB_AbaM-IME-AB2 TaxID=1243183 RepID=K4P018_9CAUD|nr:hypothetical protein FDG67_gp29 [Acinetobacter phage vB_AbaM-IME-AB2]AFV51513.1 hypothetical protein AB2_29 [Acinetobacter phage vB_AbaM-IME-AB2]
MDIEEIRKNKPEGATHYIAYEYITYHRKIGFLWYEITPAGNVAMDKSWIGLLKPL